MSGRFLAVLLVPLIAGCHFSRSVVNDYVRHLDTSWIRPGVTTRDDVIRRLGVSPSSKEGGGVTPRSFRWVCCDDFRSTLEVGYIVTPTFERGEMHFAEDILILFNEEGVVTLLSRTRSADGRNVEVVEWKE